MIRSIRNLSCGLAAAVLFFGAGCASTSESANRDTLTANVGVYPPPPSNNPKPRGAVPPFLEVSAPGSFKGDKQQLAAVAADQLTTLLDQTQRFEMVERAQVQQLLAEQNMEGIVRPDQMAKAGQVLGAQYLLIGKVTSFRIKQDATQTGVNAGGLGDLIGLNTRGETGFDQKKVAINTQVGVDIRLVDPTNGTILISKFSEFNRTDSADSMGIQVMGFGSNNDAQITVTEDDCGRVLRLAFDDAIKKMLPELDAKLAKINKTPTTPKVAVPTPPAPVVPFEPAPVTPTPAVTPSATPPAVSAKKFCPECGGAIPAGAKFCPKDGTKVE